MYVTLLRKELQNPCRSTGKRLTSGFLGPTETNDPERHGKSGYVSWMKTKKGEMERMVTRKHEGIEEQGLWCGAQMSILKHSLGG